MLAYGYAGLYCTLDVAINGVRAAPLVVIGLCLIAVLPLLIAYGEANAARTEHLLSAARGLLRAHGSCSLQRDRGVRTMG